MNTFDRTALGRKNRALFYGVDRTLYVEGGNVNGPGPTESFDGQFWKQILLKIRPEIRIKILPRGSKTNLKELARKIINDDARDVIIAMDRDYDEIFEDIIEDTRVVYTYGYSFENDIFHEKNLSDIFYSLCPICDEGIGIEEEISEMIYEFCKDGWRPHIADLCGYKLGRKVIDRERPGKYLESSTYGGRPKLSRAMFLIDVQKANSEKPRDKIKNILLKKEQLPRLSVGHLYAAFCFKLLTYLHNKNSNKTKLTKDGVISVAILNLINKIETPENAKIYKYYKNALRNC